MDAAKESPAFLGRGPDTVYTVHHAAHRERRGAVLLLGPMALERTHGYLVWVRWARLLAARGHDALRFDYRGVGESSGRFEDMTLDAWEADARACLAHLRAVCPGTPVVLHGLRLGALLAARLFAAGEGDGLLLWDPPESAEAHLLDILRRKLAADNMEQVGGTRRSRDAYVAAMEAQEPVDVEGYPWSRPLWRSAQRRPLPVPPAHETRPWRAVHLDGRPAARCLAPGRSTTVRLPRPVFWTSSQVLEPDLGALFEDGLAFLAEASAGGRRAQVAPVGREVSP